MLAENAHARLQATGDDWGIAVGSLLRAQVAALAGDVSVAAMAADAHRHAGAAGFDAFQVLRCCSRLGSPSDGATTMRRRTRISARSHSRATQDSPTTLPSRWPDWAGPRSRAETCALPGARAPRARRRRGGAVAVGSGARASGWPMPRGAGAADTAEQLYRDVLEWSTRPGRARLARVCSSRSPTTRAAARAGLDDLGRPQGTAALPARAETALTP